MKFTFSYEQTSWNNFYKPYYAIDNKRVTKDYFDYMINKYKAVFYYN